MKLLREEDVLDIEFRAKAIKDIESEWNKARKNEAIKRQEVYKDNAIKYVMLKLQREIEDRSTIALMENRASNISICRKIINKLGRVYSETVKRETGNEASDKQVEELAKLINFNKNQKKVDRLTRLHKNTLVWFYADPIGDGTFRICQKVFTPDQFDVLPMPNDPTVPGCVILSDFVDYRAMNIPLSSGPQVTELEATMTRPTDSALAKPVTSLPAKEKDKLYIWWTNNFHFTTDHKGNIVGSGTLSPEDGKNPFGLIPGVTSAEDQDEGYWADGGSDLVDGSILINTMITDKNAIMFIQGWGQLVITGTNIPDKIVIGPHKALILRHDPAKDEEESKATFISANPPLKDWDGSVEQLVALILSTNNLSPSSVRVRLDNNNAASGIAMMIDRSECTDSIQDKQNDFYWIELREWELIKRIQNHYAAKGLLAPEFKAVGPLPEHCRVVPKFKDTTGEITSRSEDLDNKKKRKELKLVSQLDLIMEENPELTIEQAKKKMEEINKEAAANAPSGTEGEDPNKEEIENDDPNPKEE